jgi:hypothetical protein
MSRDKGKPLPRFEVRLSNLLNGEVMLFYCSFKPKCVHQIIMRASRKCVRTCALCVRAPSAAQRCGESKRMRSRRILWRTSRSQLQGACFSLAGTVTARSWTTFSLLKKKTMKTLDLYLSSTTTTMMMTAVRSKCHQHHRRHHHHHHHRHHHHLLFPLLRRPLLERRCSSCWLAARQGGIQQ